LSGDISISGKSVHQDILSRYYDDVIACIRDAESIQIFGPGEANEGFQGLQLAAGRADGADDLGAKHRLPSIDRAGRAPGLARDPLGSSGYLFPDVCRPFRPHHSVGGDNDHVFPDGEHLIGGDGHKLAEDVHAWGDKQVG
jgi:hypothetical protein